MLELRFFAAWQLGPADPGRFEQLVKGLGYRVQVQDLRVLGFQASGFRVRGSRFRRKTLYPKP